eukprot:CAMPEP_0115393900 /NCGR_PEP_ID=MMETSP0271-20121206/11989_1 /TAXON_ID=71861 /ORGANISM="Scrippsiella trochoidea, Strain CCMP3099" /LENGTH=111 /DNA_ID=CAMNT_0002817555 /DNA_START=548 /DNA_END=880 /DNA_ORIENTATION=+
MAWPGFGAPCQASVCMFWKGMAGMVNTASFSFDGALALTASIDCSAKIWIVTSGECLYTLAGHSKPVFSAAFSPDGALALTTSSDYTAKIWSVASGECLYTLAGHGKLVFS